MRSSFSMKPSLRLAASPGLSLRMATMTPPRREAKRREKRGTTTPRRRTRKASPPGE
jgi:hypothetical protein